MRKRKEQRTNRPNGFGIIGGQSAGGPSVFPGAILLYLGEAYKRDTYKALEVKSGNTIWRSKLVGFLD
jgi:hypothetical protein